jgi:hypothetical protein
LNERLSGSWRYNRVNHQVSGTAGDAVHARTAGLLLLLLLLALLPCHGVEAALPTTSSVNFY